MPSKKESFVLLPDRVLLSERMNRVSVHARWMFTIMLTKWRRGKSKQRKFTFTYTELCRITRYRRDRVSSCLKELQGAGMIEKEPGGLERNRNAYTVDHEWLAIRRFSQVIDPALPLIMTHGKVESLADEEQQNPMSYEDALSLDVDLDRML